MPSIHVDHKTNALDLQKFASQMSPGEKLRATFDKNTKTYTLYTSSKGGGSGLKEFLFGTVSKRQAAAHSALNMIMWNTSGLAGNSGDMRALHSALSHIKSGLATGGDVKLADLQPMATSAADAFKNSPAYANSILPKGVTVGSDWKVTGQVALKDKLLPDGSKVPVKSAVQDGVDRRLAGPQKPGAKDFKSVNGISVHQEFLDDALRMDFTINGKKTNTHVVSSSEGRATGEAEATKELNNLAGSANATKVLSAFLHQGTMNNLTGFMETKDGSLHKLCQIKKDITNATYVDNSGTKHDLGVPKQYGAMRINVDKFNDGSGDFKVSLDWDYHFAGVGQSASNFSQLVPSDESRSILMNTTAEFRISKQQADAGKLDFQFTQPPTSSFSGSVQP